MAAFKKCGELAQQNGYSQIGLATPTKGNLDGIISDIVGEKAVSILQRENVLVLRGFTIYLITKRVKPKGFSGPVLAAYTPIDQTREIAKSLYCKALVYVPWTEDEAPEFEKQFNSVVIYGG